MPSPQQPRLVEDKAYRWMLGSMLIVAFAFANLPSGLELMNDPDLIANQGELNMEGSWVRRVQWMPLFLIGFYVCARRFAFTQMMIVNANPFLLLLTAWAICGVLYSEYPASTARKVFQLVGTVAMAIAFQIASWKPGRFAEMMRIVTFGLVASSVLWVFINPAFAVHHMGEYDGAWRGVVTHKNGMGVICCYTAIFWLHAWASRELSFYKIAIPMGVTLLILLMTRSTTSLLTTMMGGALVIIMCRQPLDLRGWKLRIAVSSIVALCLFPILLVVAFGEVSPTKALEEFTTMIGKDITFTGRTDIWEMVLGEWARKPLQGYGIGAFWVGDARPAIAKFIREFNWTPGQAHSGYIGLMIDTGLVGLLLFVGFLAHHSRQLGQLARLNPQSFALHFTLLIYILISNVTEANFFTIGAPTFVLMIFASLTLSREIMGYRMGWQKMPSAVRAT